MLFLSLFNVFLTISRFLFADLGSARESSSVTQRNSGCSKIGLPGCHNARFVVFKLGGWGAGRKMVPLSISTWFLFCWRITKNVNIYIPFLVRSPKDGELLSLEWGMTIQVTNVMCPDENSGVRYQYCKDWDKIWCLTWRERCWKFFKFFVRPRVVVGKYLEIFHQGEGESTVL